MRSLIYDNDLNLAKVQSISAYSLFAATTQSRLVDGGIGNLDAKSARKAKPVEDEQLGIKSKAVTPFQAYRTRKTICRPN